MYKTLQIMKKTRYLPTATGWPEVLHQQYHSGHVLQMSPSSRLQLTLHNLNLPQYVHRKEWLAIFNFPPLKAHFQVGFSENLRLDGQNCCLPFLGGAIQKDPQDPATMALPENFTSWLSMTHFWSPKTIGTSSTETDNLFLVPLREHHCSPQPEQNAFGGKVLGLFGICMGWCWS